LYLVLAQTCLVCGEIRSIREVHDRGTEAKARTTPGTPSGLDTGPVVGTVARLEFGRGSEASGGGWRFGAAGTPEMQARFGETSYEITVAMDDGERRTVQRRDVGRFHVGQRVALRSGELEPM
jgi:outer membrane lipoprotein SlyB